ncbi:MAG: 3,4-dihydroxy-2-butanone-4-phosphate synthase [Burkholderiales bacterium]
MAFDDGREFPVMRVPEQVHSTGDLVKQLDTVPEAIRKIAEGEMVIVVDDDEREDEGDLVVAASRVKAEQVAFMIRHTSGILCVPMLAGRARALRLDPMVVHNDAPLSTAFTVSTDYKPGLTTGISAKERAATVRALADEKVPASDFVRPGHIFPLIAKEGGVLVRSGHTEAAMDLARLAGLPAVGLIGELVNDDGTVKRKPSLLAFAKSHGLTIISINDLIAHRQQREQLIQRIGEYRVATHIGSARALAYSTSFDAVQHLALVFGDVAETGPVPVRIHREQVIADVFGTRDSAHSIVAALERIQRAGRGVLIYLRDGSAGAESPSLAGQGHAVNGATSERNRQEQWRQVGLGAQILRDLGISSIRLLATRQVHYVGLAGFGVSIDATEMIR